MREAEVEAPRLPHAPHAPEPVLARPSGTRELAVATVLLPHRSRQEALSVWRL